MIISFSIMDQLDFLLPINVINGINLFNHGKFFEAHEALEIAWREEPGLIRFLYQGILQLGVGYYHLERGNLSGARKLLERSRLSLMKIPDLYRGVYVTAILDHVEELDFLLSDPSHTNLPIKQIPLHKIPLPGRNDDE